MMKHNLWYRIVRWLIRHSRAGMTYVIEMRNEVADGYEYWIDRLNDFISDMEKLLEEKGKEQRNE